MALLLRFRVLLSILCGVTALYALLGFVVAPYAVQTYAIPALSERLRRPVLLGDVRINPFTFAVTLTAFEIQEPDRTPMLGFQELFVNFEGTSLLRSAYHFDDIRLTLPFGFVHVRPDGRVNLLDLAAPQADQAAAPPPPPPAEKAPLPPVEIRELTITQGVLEYQDDTKKKPVTLDVVPIEVTLRNFSTRRGGENAYAFTAEFGKGERLDWEGDVYLDPLESTGRVTIADVKLGTFWPSFRDQYRFDILSGTVKLEARYHFDTAGSPVNVQVTDGSLGVNDLRLAAAGTRDPVLSLASLAVDGVQLDLPKRTLDIQSVRLAGGDIRTWLAPDKTMNLSTLFAPVGGESAPPPPTEPAPAPWKTTVQKVEVADTRVTFDDRTLTTPVSVTADQLTAKIGVVQVPLTAPIPVFAKWRLNEQGTMEAQGTVRVDPLDVDLAVVMARIGLPPFQPYLQRVTQFDVKSGELEAAGQFRYRSPHEPEPMMRYRGAIGLKQLHLLDRATKQEFLGWTALGLSKVALDVSPTSVKIGEVALRDPAVHLVSGKDGSLNLSRVFRAPEDASAPPPADPPKATGKPASAVTPVAIDLVTLSKLSATFLDEGIEPPVTIGVHDMSGTVKGLSSKQVAKADVKLAGKVNRVAPLSIQGRINPLSEEAYTDLTFRFHGMDLTAASPYAGRYAGFPIDKGSLSLDLKYQVSKHQLVGENKVVIDQFTFGEKTDSPDATGLPVRLAVALLKDRHGKIDIDMPVRGDLNEPDFKYGRVVLSALVNLISKAATSPFAALGGLIEGGGGEDLQYIEFPIGEHELGTAERHKLGSVAKALEERPALRVEVIGAADTARDRDALAREQLQVELDRRASKQGSKAPDALSQERQLELLSDLYAEKLGTQPMKDVRAADGAMVQRVMTLDELREALVPVMTVEPAALRELAQARATAIRDQLIGPGTLPEDRVVLMPPELTQTDGTTVRTRLNLTGS